LISFSAKRVNKGACFFHYEGRTWQEVLLNVGLDSSKQERTQDLVKGLYDLLVPFGLSLPLAIFLVQELVKILVAGKDLRTNKVEKGEQLLEIVLQRGTGNEKSTT